MILSFDPGKENFAVSVQDISSPIPTVIKVSLFKNMIKELTSSTVDINELTALFIKEVLSFFKEYEIESCSLERYQVRFRTTGNIPEVVNIMIGIIFSICTARKVKVNTTIAGTWNNDFNHILPILLEKAFKLEKSCLLV